MGWASFIGALVSIVASLIRWAETRKILEAHDAKAMAQILKGSIHVLDRVEQARNTALREFDARNGMPDDSDPNLRD